MPKPKAAPWSEWVSSPDDPRGSHYRARQTRHGGLEYEFRPHTDDASIKLDPESPAPASEASDSNIDEAADSRYRIQKSKNWLPGTVLKAHWTDELDTHVTEPRLFIIISTDRKERNSLCAPVTETAGKNCKDINSSIIPEAHALLRSPYDPGIRPPYKRLETVDMTATPDGEPLMHTSYICYHGLVTFEHNVSVFVIGNIKKDHFMRVEDGVNRFWASEQNNQGELETGSDGTWDEEPIQELRHKSSLPWIMSNSASDTSLVESRHSRPPASRSASASTGTKPDLEAMRARLYRAAASSPQEYKDDSFCFPFSALPDDSNYALEPARGRVKIDTGARENWISTRFLKRASITFTRDDSLGTYRGANGESFKPLGFVLVTWYSINQALTSIDNFLVGKDTPFDAILGSDWVDEYGLDGFREAVLPLRLVMSKDRSSDLKKRQAETGAANKNVADHQRAQSRSLREQNRKKQAGSRTTSRIEDSSDFDSQESTYRASSSSARHR